MIKLVIIFLILGCENITSNDTDIPYKPTRSFSIEMLNERNFPMRVDRKGEYHIDISSKHQSIFKMKATTNRPKQTERITWSKNQSYLWSNGLVVDDYCLVNPSSYTKDGVGYSMVGFMPKMENSSVVIYGHYGTLTDSIVVHIE